MLEISSFSGYLEQDSPFFSEDKEVNKIMTGYILLKMAFGKLYQYSSNKKLQIRVKKFYKDKILSKQFTNFRYITNKLKMNRIKLEIIQSITYKRIHRIIKDMFECVNDPNTIAQGHYKKVLKRRLFKEIYKIHLNKNRAIIEYYNTLKKKLLVGLKYRMYSAKLKVMYMII